MNSRMYDSSDFDIIMHELTMWEHGNSSLNRDPYINVLRGTNNIIKVSWKTNITYYHPIDTWESEIRQVLGDNDSVHVSLSTDEMRTLVAYYTTSQRNDISYINNEIGVGVRIPTMGKLNMSTMADGSVDEEKYIVL